MPTLRARKTATAPILSEVMQRISAAQSTSEIAAETKAVSAYFKGDADAIAEFWLSGDYEYSLDEESHREVLRWLFTAAGLQQPLIAAFLDDIESRRILADLGVTRVGTQHGTHYRIRVGERA